MSGFARLHSLFGFGDDDKLEGFFVVQRFAREYRCTLDQDYEFVDAA